MNSFTNYQTTLLYSSRPTGVRSAFNGVTLLVTCACLLAGLAMSPAARADTLYDNSSTRSSPERFAQSGFEFGDEIILAGPATGTWVITNFQYEYFGFGPDFTANSAMIRLRFYDNEGVDGRPLNLLFDSGFSAIPATPDEGNVLEYAGLCVSVSKNFTWTVEFMNATPSMGLQSSGLDLYDPPTVGSTYDDFWERSGPGNSWALRAPLPGQPPISFGARALGTLPGVPAGGMELWLKADAGITGSPVAVWSDQSGNSRHAGQANLASRPTLVPNAVNGMPAVRFDGVDDFMTFNLPVNGLTGMTIFMVAANTANQTAGATQAERAALFWNESLSWGTVYLSPFQTQVSFRFGTTQVGNNPLYTRPASVGSAFTLSTSVKDGMTDSLYVNQVLVLSQGGKLPAIAGTLPTGNIARGYNDNTFFIGDVAEIIVYPRALCDAEREGVEAYLTAKYFGTPPPQPPVIITQPANQTVTEPNPATFCVVATGTAPLSYQWRTNGVDIPGATSSCYTKTPTSQATDNGLMFTVVVTNLYGAVTSMVATLTVNAAPVVPTAGQALWLRADAGTTLNGAAVSQWNDQSGNGRHAVQMSAGSQPLKVNGFVNGQPAICFDGTDDFMTFNMNVNGLSSMTIFLVAANTPAQTVGATRAERAAIFWNETTSWGTVYLSPFQTQVSFRFGTTQVGNWPLHNRPASIGSSFSLSTAIKNGTTDTLRTNKAVALIEGGKLATTAGNQPVGNLARGFNNNTYFAGYIAEVIVYTNALTSMEIDQVEAYLDSKYAITAQPPMITVHPANQTVTAPNPATFTVTATGTAPLSYQWRTNGVNIPGANSSSYTKTPTAVTDSGTVFDVIVSNPYGMVTSNPATLTVNPPSTLPSPGLSLWFKADSGISGSPVAQWDDQSGNARHAVQGTAASRPTLVPGALNGLPVVRFDGLNDFMTFTYNVNGLTGMTIFMVAANTSSQTVGPTQAERAALFWNETASWGTVYVSPFQTQVAWRFGTTQVGNQPLYFRPASIGSSFSTTTTLKNSTVDSLYVNGTLVQNMPGKATTITAIQTTGNLARGYNDNTFFIGDIAEVIVYNRALTPAERLQVEQYLSSKYGLPAPPMMSPVAGLLAQGALLRTEVDAEGGVRIVLQGEPGAAYVIEHSPNLVDWAEAALATLPDADPAVWTQVLHLNGSVGFFRARRR